MARKGFRGIRYDLSTAQLTEYDEDNFLAVHADGYGEDASRGAAELHHPFGFISRPRDPDDTGACLIKVWLEGDKDYALLLEDVRIAAVLPPLTKGSSAQYAYFGGFILLDNETKTETHYIPYAPGKAHTIQVGVDSNGKSILELSHGEGTRVTMLEKSIVVGSSNGQVWLEINDDGWTLWGNGKIAGSVDVAMDENSFPLAKAPQVTAALNAIMAAFNAGGTGGGPAPVKLTGAEAVTAAIQAAVAALPTTMVKGF